MVDKSNYGKIARENENTTQYGYDPDILTETIRLRLLNNAAIVRNLGDSTQGKVGSKLGQFNTANNLNTVTDAGKYAYGENVAGNPETGQKGILEYYRTDNERYQYAASHTGCIYFRIKNSDSNFTDSDTWVQLTNQETELRYATKSEAETGSLSRVIMSPFTTRSAINEFGIPIGGMIDWPGSSLPNSNWTWADGRELSRTNYSQCFAEIGTTYGAGNGSTTFNVPNVNGGRFVRGGNASQRGQTGGQDSFRLTGANMPAHTHNSGSLRTNTAGRHSHTYRRSGTSSVRGQGSENASRTISDTTSTNGDHSHSITGTTGSSGRTTPDAIDNRPAYITIPKIIKIR